MKKKNCNTFKKSRGIGLRIDLGIDPPLAMELSSSHHQDEEKQK